MTEKAGEELLVKVYGFTREDAGKLVEVPPEKIKQSLDDAQRNTET